MGKRAQTRLHPSLLERPKSITHQHLLSVVNTILKNTAASGPAVRLLDAGCGDGSLIGYLAANLPLLHPAPTFEIFGFDVHDHGVQETGFLSTAISALAARFPHVPWAERIVSVSVHDPWPYPDAFFDFIVSNQVLEHVQDHDYFFAQIHRTLKPGGCSVHLFPLKHCVREAHLHLPFASRVMNHDLLRGYIAWLSRMRLGKYPAQHRETGIALAAYAEQLADYMLHFTNYLKYHEVLLLGKKHHLRPSFRYTKEYYLSKARAVLGRPPSFAYSAEPSPLADRLSIFFLKFVSNVTLFLEKRQSYRR